MGEREGKEAVWLRKEKGKQNIQWKFLKCKNIPYALVIQTYYYLITQKEDINFFWLILQYASKQHE